MVGGGAVALVFEYEKDLQTGTQPFISSEPDSVLYNYFVEDEFAKDRSATALLGYYDDITFGNEGRHLTTKAISRIGIKNFPGIGGIGFYKDAYSDDSRILAPIHLRHDTQKEPTLITAEIVDNKFHVVIEHPTNIKYECYRVIARQGRFAFEYITYKTECFVDVPEVNGEYTVYCIGYDEANGTVSSESNELLITVTTGADSWIPPSTSITDVEARLKALEDSMGDVGVILDEINGVEV